MTALAEPVAPPAAAESRALQQRVLNERVAAIYYNYDATFIARSIFVLALGGCLYLQLHDPLVLPFVAVHLVLYIGLYFLPRWNRAVPAADSAKWARRLTRIVILMGVADAATPWLFIRNGDPTVTTVLMVLMMGNCARAVQSLRPLKRAMLGHTLTMMGGLITALAWQADGLHLFLSAFAAIYLLMMLRVGVQEHGMLTDALMLRFENEALVARLGEQVAATERASAEKTRFLATASHDLRQPLHAIALFGAALQYALRGHAEEANAQRLMSAVNALGTSLDTLLDISRLDAGVVRPTLAPVSLDALFLPLNQLFTPRAEQKELQLRVRASGLWVLSDAQLLQRLLSNLIDNALKYTRRGGVTVVAHAQGDTVWVEVRDTGIGIAPQQLERVFEEFYQVDNPGRDRSRGLGIGLSIVRRLSSLLAHPVQVHSRPGRGTHFRVLLPAAGAAAGVDASAVDARRCAMASDPAKGLPRRVLLVDDEAEVRAAMAELLRSHGVALQAVADEGEARQAIDDAQAKGAPFDLLLCDYRLGNGANGLEAGQRLCRRTGTRMAMLLVTGETAPERLQQVRASGVPVLFKPVPAQTLLRAMAELAAAPLAR